MLALITAGILLGVRSHRVQTWLAQRAAAYITEKTGARTSIGQVKITFFTNAELSNFCMEDLAGDTMLYARELSVQFRLFSLLGKKLRIAKIKLAHGAVKIVRDSTGTHTNLSEVFRKLVSPGASGKKQAPAPDWELRLNRLTLLHSEVHYTDYKAGSHLRVLVPLLDVSVNNFGLDNKIIALKTVNAENVDVSVRLTERTIAQPDTPRATHFLKNIVQVTWEKLNITNASFALHDEMLDTVPVSGINFHNLKISDLHLHADDGCIVDDTISAHISHLSAREQSGFHLQQLTADVRVSVNDITLSELLLKTDHSEIKDFLALRYTDFYDFRNFMTHVRLDARLTESRLSLRDLNYFLHRLQRLEHNNVLIDGEVRGSISNLRGKNISLRTGSHTQFKGDFSTRGLPDIFETSLNLRIERLATTAADVQRIMPGIKIPDNIKKLGLIYYTGYMDGFLTDIFSEGKLVTGLGTAQTNMSFRFDKKTKRASYSGNLALQNFELGKFLNQEKELGIISLQANVRGRGITPETLDDTITGTISQFVFHNHLYENIRINGRVANKSFTGKLRVNDRALSMDFTGKADLSGTQPVLKFEASIDSVKPRELNFGKHDIFFAGDVVADFTGKRLDDAIGNIRLTRCTIRRDTIVATLANASLEARMLSNEHKTITLLSDVAQAQFTGDFTFAELPKALTSFVKKTFTRQPDDTVIHRQRFTAELQIYDPPENLTRIIHPSFTRIRNTHALMSFNSIQQQLDARVTIPELRFGNLHLQRTNLTALSAEGFFDFDLHVDKLYSRDSVWLDTLSVIAKTLENKDIRLDIRVADKTNFNHAHIVSRITPQVQQALVRLEPGDVKLGNYHWRFDPGNYILVRGKQITSHGLVFRSDEQRVYIASYLKNDTSTCVRITLDNTSIADFTGIFTQKVRDIQGNVNGKIVMEDVFYRPLVFADFVVNEMHLGNELIGDVNIESKLDEGGKRILLLGSVKSAHPVWYNQNNINLKGYLTLDAKPTISVFMDAPRIGLNFLNYKFFEKYVKDCRGYARAKAMLEGPLNKLTLKGDVWLINDTVTVSFLNTTYHVRSHRVRLDERGFDFGKAVVFDIRDSMITATGRINHENFKKFSIDLTAETENGQFLNTNENLSPYFYGEAYGAGSVRFKGPFTLIQIHAVASTRSGTYCRLPITTSYETNRYTFFKFVNKTDSAQPVKTTPPRVSGVNFTLDLDVTPDARMDIILDPIAGDVLTGYGHGNLKVEIPRSGNISMYGTYEIDRGNYLFTLQNIINKRFDIYKGGTINFNGDIYKANLLVDAVYQVRTSTTDLIEDVISTGGVGQQGGNNLNQQLAASQSRVPVRLFLNLRGPLERPNIGFDIQVVDPDPTIKSYIDQRIAQLKLYENDLNKQVFGLLVMNRFLPQSFLNQGGSNPASGNFVGGTAANTVGEMLSTQLANYLNSLLSSTDVKALQNLNINLGYRQYDQLSNNANTTNPVVSLDTRREIQLALQQRLLNNRLIINAGGNLDIGNSNLVQSGTGHSTGARAVIPTGDFQLEYLLTPDGAWRARAFNRTNYDFYNSRNNNRTGVGISFRKDFDKPREIFIRNKRNVRKKSPVPVKPASAKQTNRAENTSFP
ncbi:MAG: translocation/assembly module TamB [Chitinophagales bacterium]|nr:translocation/assembly module TamB [Chitinophagales bacterium]MDW8419405.1 translocation/assembly module TamB domain-containing protein [Chitinophagales bacterium]